MPTLRQAAAASRQRSGGSRSETNSPRLGRRGSRASRPASAAGPRRGSQPPALRQRRAVRRRGASARNSPSRDLDGARLDDPVDRPAARGPGRRRPSPAGSRTGSDRRPPGNANGRRRGPASELAQRRLAESDLALLGLLPGVEESDPRPAASRRGGRAARRRPASPRGAGRARRPGGPSGAGSGRPPRTSSPASPGPGTPSGWLEASPPPVAWQ